MQLFDPNTGTVAAFVVAPGTYADGDTIRLRRPQFEARMHTEGAMS